jgi:uncharacterized integral membrane protein
LNRAPRPPGSLFRKIVAALILAPLAAVIIAFAVANRERVTVSLDPFSSDQSAAFVTRPLPLFLLLMIVLILGVVIGGFASWLRHGRWRRVARRLEGEADRLRGELKSLKRTTGAAPRIPESAEPPERLKLSPPLH